MRRSRIRFTARFQTRLGLTQRRKDAKSFLRQTIDYPLNSILHQVGIQRQAPAAPSPPPLLPLFQFHFRSSWRLCVFASWREFVFFASLTDHKSNISG